MLLCLVLFFVEVRVVKVFVECVGREVDGFGNEGGEGNGYFFYVVYVFGECFLEVG